MSPMSEPQLLTKKGKKNDSSLSEREKKRGLGVNLDRCVQDFYLYYCAGEEKILGE